MAVTSIDIDPELLREIKALYGIRTNKEAVDFALRDALMRARQLAAIDAISGLQLDLDPLQIDYGR